MKGGIVVKKVCFGTLFDLIYQARASSKFTNEIIITAIFKAYCLDRENFGFDTSHLKNGHDNVPMALVHQAQTLESDVVDANFQKYVVPCIRTNKWEALVRSIKAIINEDQSIGNDTIIGYVTGYEKKTILSSNTFRLSSLLASIFYYSIVFIDNSQHENPRGLVDSLDDSSLEHIYFENEDTKTNNHLSPTINDDLFKSVFVKIDTLRFDTNFVPSSVEVFTVDIANQQFKFTNTKQFILEIISNYVMSRSKINSTSKKQELMAIGAKALLDYMHYFTMSENTILGETLLYVFLECVLKAPKIMTKIELNTSLKSNSDGIYLLRTSYKGYPVTQLVFGASHIINDLKDAVDLVLDRIESIQKNDENEFLIVNENINTKYFDEESIQFLKNVIKPNKEENDSPEMAFGCFLGYKFKIDKEIPRDKPYSEYVKNRLKEDANDIKTYIEESINKRGFSGYNFYFYIVPFNDAEVEKVNLIKELI